MPEIDYKSAFEFTKDTSYLALKGQLWGVVCEDFGGNGPRYMGTTLYLCRYLSFHYDVVPQIVDGARHLVATSRDSILVPSHPFCDKACSGKLITKFCSWYIWDQHGLNPDFHSLARLSMMEAIFQELCNNSLFFWYVNCAFYRHCC